MKSYLKDLQELRVLTGMGLRECKDALEKYGSLEKARVALADPKARDAHEDAFAQQRKYAELYVALRDSGLYVASETSVGWVWRPDVLTDTTRITAASMDAPGYYGPKDSDDFDEEATPGTRGPQGQVFGPQE